MVSALTDRKLPATDGRRRVVIESVRPQVEGGRFPIKRVVGETVVVEAEVFADGHDELTCRLLYRHEQGRGGWMSAELEPLGNDLWRGAFNVSQVGRYRYTVEAWIDHVGTWRRDLLKKIEAAQDIEVEKQIGAGLIEEAADRAPVIAAAELRHWAAALLRERNPDSIRAMVSGDDLPAIAGRYPDRKLASVYELELSVVVDREKARFSTWYEVFPRSCAAEPGRHGTFEDCEQWLPYIASMGFDVVYLPPIHPIGRAFRKGKNNTPVAEPGDVGSPWAVGAEEGGHKSVHPQLGSLDGFRSFLTRAAAHGLEVALDIAFQCTPDHSYAHQHPEWFRMRPDGTIQYAENPPKKYQDIYPLDFETAHWQELWEELRSVLDFWIGNGVHIFRVDNPHTKAFPFWEWVIGEIKQEHPDVLFLAEAFTRPHAQHHLAKLGFSQSYTYFTWRNTKQELTDYFQELTATEVREFFRPNLWPNTPDILSGFLQTGGRPAFMIRLLLAATMGANYGIYGPAFELCENTPREAGSEEYAWSEKYELRQRDLAAPWSLKDMIARINHIRRENPALQSDRTLRFHEVDNPQLICYSKTSGDLANVVIVVVNLDPRGMQSGWVNLDLSSLGIAAGESFQVSDLLNNRKFLWRGARNYVALTPETLPAHVLLVEHSYAR